MKPLYGETVRTGNETSVGCKPDDSTRGVPQFTATKQSIVDVFCYKGCILILIVVEMDIHPTQSESDVIIWGTQNLPIGEPLLLTSGTLQLYLQRNAFEWQVQTRHLQEGEIGRVPEAGASVDTEWEETDRYVFRATRGDYSLTPCLADRAIVSRPVTDFHLPPMEAVTIYVSTPIWVRLELEGNSTLRQEFATQVLSDTWFGPDQITGELCYASRTHARLRLEEMPSRPSRAITPIRLQNQSAKMLRLNRINLPVTFLSLYQDPNGQLWTEEVTLIHEEEAELAPMKIGSGAPPQAGQAQRISEARKKADKTTLVRAFSTLFRG